MQSFLEFSIRYLIDKKFMQTSLDLPREEMPQILGKHMDDFIKFLYDNQIPYHTKLVHPDNLKATQNEYNPQKIWELSKIPDENLPPSKVIVSNDGFILDGHHRVFSAAFKNKLLNVIHVDLPIKDLLAKCHDFEGVAYKKLHEEAA